MVPRCNARCLYMREAVQFSSVAQSFLTLCDPTDCSTPGLPVHHQLSGFTQTHVHWVSNQPTISSSVVPFSSCLQSFPASGSFLFFCFLFFIYSNESVLCILWPKYWSFSFSISPSNEHSGLISFRMDWLYLLAVQGTLKSLLQHICIKDISKGMLRQNDPWCKQGHNSRRKNEHQKK